VVQELADTSRGPSSPQISELELETLKSTSVLHADEASKTSPREIALWSLAAVMAIVLGVIPALWINRWRAESVAAPRVEAQQPQAAATDDEPETIEMTAEPEQETVSPPGAFTPTRIKTSKPHRAKPERVKQPAPPRTPKQPPPCDVYLHPKGCPR
jgi:hypothetical protein